MSIDCVVPARADLGESPVWSEREGLLYWIDIDGCAIHRYDPTTGVDESFRTQGRPGALALTSTPGRLFVAMEHQAGFVSWGDSTFELLADLEASGTGNRLNDGRATPEGNMVVGSMYEITQERRSTGILHRVTPGGEVTVLRTEIGVSNGQAFGPDDTYYFADTFTRTIWQYDWADGTPHNERVFFEFPDTLAGGPDGAAVDADGCYWIACVNGWSLARITPAGRLDRVIELPFKRPTMPAFGGPDFATMFVTSIGVRGPDDPRENEFEPGGLFALDVGVAGVPEPYFGA